MRAAACVRDLASEMPISFMSSTVSVMNACHVTTQSLVATCVNGLR